MTTVRGWFDCGVLLQSCNSITDGGVLLQSCNAITDGGVLLQNCIAITDGGVLLQNCIAVTDEGSWTLPIKGDVKCKEYWGEECKFVIIIQRWRQRLMHFAFSTSCKEIT